MDARQKPENQPNKKPAAQPPGEFDRDAYFAEKREKIDKLIDGHLEKLAADLDAGKSDTLKQYLTTMSRFHRYSFGNQILIAIQAPQATHVAGFHAWRKDFGRFVKKGEHGLFIFAPITKLVGNTDEVQKDGTAKRVPVRRIVNVKPVTVFDVSQTDGQPLPEFASVKGEPSEFLSKLEALYKKQGVLLEYVDVIGGGALGQSEGQRVKVLTGLPPGQKFQTGVHELAHELLHKDEERRKQTTKTIRETEAEAVAFVVCSGIGLDCSTASSDYLQLYGGSRATLEASLQAIRDVSKFILDAILTERANEGSADGEDGQ